MLEAGPMWNAVADGAMLSGPTTRPAAVRRRRRTRSASSTDVWVGGPSMASPTRRRPAHGSTGGGPACSGAAPIIGAAFTPVRPRTTSAARASTGWAMIGRSATTISSRTTTRSTGSSAYSAAPKACPMIPTAFPTAAETAVLRVAHQAGLRQTGVRCIPSRLSILTQPHNNRAACHYCGQCNRGCKTNSNFASPGRPH